MSLSDVEVKGAEEEEEFDSEASLREVYLFNLSSQGNIYTLTNLHLNNSQKLLVGTLNRKMYCLEFDRHHLEHDGEGANPEVKDLQFTYIPSGAEIVSIDAFSRSTHKRDFVIGITIIKLHSNDPGSGGADVSSGPSSCGGQYLNIYSDWEQPGGVSTGYFLENLSQSCLSLELDFIPYQLTHCEVILPGTSVVEIVWVLLGSDCRAHIYVEDPLTHSYVDAKDVDAFKRLFPELDRVFPSVPIWIDFYDVKEASRRLTAVGCEDGELFLWLVDLSSQHAKILVSSQTEFEGSVSQVKFFRPFNDDVTRPKMFADVDLEIIDPSSINLLAVSSLSPSVVFENVIAHGLDKSRTLFRSDDFDVATCATLADVDFDGEKEIVIGTFGQELLVYKLVEKVEEVKKKKDPEAENEDVEIEKKIVLKWELMWTRAFNAPILSVSNLDLTGDGIEEIAVATSRGLQILQHDIDKVQDLLETRFQRLLEQEAN